MSSQHPTGKPRASSESQVRLRRYVWLSRIAFGFAIGGFIAILLATACLPGGLSNPKALGSFFVVAAASGSYLDTSRLLFIIGGCLVACATVLRYLIRVSFQ